MEQSCIAHEMYYDEILHLRENQGKLFDRTEGVAIGLAEAQGNIKLVAEIVSRVEEEVKTIGRQQDEKMDEIIARIASIPKPTQKRSSKRWVAAIIAAALGSGGIGSVVSALAQSNQRPNPVATQSDQPRMP